METSIQGTGLSCWGLDVRTLGLGVYGLGSIGFWVQSLELTISIKKIEIRGL